MVLPLALAVVLNPGMGRLELSLGIAEEAGNLVSQASALLGHPWQCSGC